MAAFLDNCGYTPTAGSTTDWTYSARVAGYNNPADAGITNGRVYKYHAFNAARTEWEIGEGAYNTGTGVLARTTVLFNSSQTGTASGQSGAGTKISFSAAPTVIIVGLREDLIAVEEANSFTAAQQTQARTNISAAHIAAMATHNAVVNPAVDVSQELGATGATLVNNTAKYTADQWEGMYNHGAATAVVVSGQNGANPPASFQFGHILWATTAITSPANGDFAKHRTKIEGHRIVHWGWGAAGAAPIVVAFWLFSTAAGTGFVKLSNSTQARCYYHEFSVVNGNNFIAFTVLGDTTGTWQGTTSAGLVFEVFASGKETTPQSTLDAWGTGNKVQTTNSTNLLGTNSNLTALTGVYIDIGTQLPVAGDLAGLMRRLTEELPLCQRYLAYTDATGRFKAAAGSDVLEAPAFYPVPMRATPTVTVGTPLFSANLAATYPQIIDPNTRAARFKVQSNAAGDTYAVMTPLTLDARL